MSLLHSEYSLEFDGVNDYVAVGDVSELSFDDSDEFSISAWVRLSPTGGYEAVLMKMEAGPNFRGYYIGFDTVGALIFSLRNIVTTLPLP